MVVTIATLTAIASVGALYLWEAHQVRIDRRNSHTIEPIRSGTHPEFARLGEQDWYDCALTSTEWSR
jgi:hypothetical protein